MRRTIPLAVAITGACLLVGSAFLYGFASGYKALPPHDTLLRLNRGVRDVVRNGVRVMVADESSSELAGPTGAGRWRRLRRPSAISLTSDQEAAMARLDSLGYLRGVTPATDRQEGITEYDSEKALNALNLVVSAHAPEAFIMDMEGETLHRWSYDFWSAFPESDTPRDVDGVGWWRRTRVLDNGDLLAIFEGHGLIQIDKNSDLVWAFPGRAHHDLDFFEDGSIGVLTRKIKIIPEINETEPVLEDFVTVLDGDGALIAEYSLLEALRNSKYSPLLRRMPRAGDIFHTNTLNILDGSHAEKSPVFEKGNVLVSIHALDTIGIVDLDLGQFVWAMTGMWSRQHEPVLLPNGNMLLFDNQGAGEGRSRVLEFDPLTQTIEWFYQGDGEGDFFSELLGSAQRLPNGNTLITDSETGEAFEVTPDKVPVWRHRTPYRAGEDLSLIATLAEVVRMDKERLSSWLPQ